MHNCFKLFVTVCEPFTGVFLGRIAYRPIVKQYCRFCVNLLVFSQFLGV
nr:MAG TPA: hypothetical protein [Caudoviricetes sp.]